MYFDEKFADQHWWDKEWLVPQFNDPRLHGDELVNECDLFMLLKDYSNREKVAYLERSLEGVSCLQKEVERLISVKGVTEHLLKSREMLSKLVPLMAKRQTYINKFRPETKG